MRKIINDFIAEVSLPDGANINRARILVDDAGNAAVFVPDANNKPKIEAIFQSDKIVNPNHGTDITESLKWQRRGVSCNYPLARCKYTSDKLAELW